MNNPELKVTIEPNISIEQLQALQAKGYSVQRSAHIGNQQPYNMTLFARGIPALLVDHTITGVDKAYRPEQIMRGFSSEVIADIGRIASRTSTTVNGESGFLDEIHNQSLLQAIPGACIETSTEYARRNESIFRATITAALETMPEIFNRTVADDTVIKSSASVASSRASSIVETYGIMQLNDNPRDGQGVMLPNEVDIVANYISEAIDSNADTIYHLSGPDMVVYSVSPKIASRIEQLFIATTRQPAIAGKIPESLRVVLVPTADARFATTSHRSSKLTALTDRASDLATTQDEFRAVKAEFFRSTQQTDASARDALLQKEREVLGVAKEELAQAILECPGIIDCYKAEPFVSQYDVIKEGGLFVASPNTTMTMENLSQITKQLRKIAKDKSREPG